MADKRYGVTYNNMTTDGAGSGYKVERVQAPSIGGSCFASMKSANDLEMHCSQAPAFHDFVTKRIIAMGKVRNDEQSSLPEGTVLDEPDFDLSMPEELTRAQPHNVKHNPIRKVKAHSVPFSRGMEVFDRAKNKKGIIIQASVGYTANRHAPVHKLCSSSGKVWLAKEYNLKQL